MWLFQSQTAMAAFTMATSFNPQQLCESHGCSSQQCSDCKKKLKKIGGRGGGSRGHCCDTMTMELSQEAELEQWKQNSPSLDEVCSTKPINTKAQIVQTELVRRDVGLELSLKMEPLFYHCISQHRTTLFWARLNIVTREVGLALTDCWSFLTVHCSVTVTVLGQSFHQPYPLTINWIMYTLCISPLTIKIAICQHNHWNNELDVGSTKRRSLPLQDCLSNSRRMVIEGTADCDFNFKQLDLRYLDYKLSLRCRDPVSMITYMRWTAIYSTSGLQR